MVRRELSLSNFLGADQESTFMRQMWWYFRLTWPRREIEILPLRHSFVFKFVPGLLSLSVLSILVVMVSCWARLSLSSSTRWKICATCISVDLWVAFCRPTNLFEWFWARAHNFDGVVTRGSQPVLEWLVVPESFYVVLEKEGWGSGVLLGYHNAHRFTLPKRHLNRGPSASEVKINRWGKHS